MQQSELISTLKNLGNEAQQVYDNYPKQSHLTEKIQTKRQEKRRGNISGFVRLGFGYTRLTNFAVDQLKRGNKSALENEIDQLKTNHTRYVQNAESRVDRLFSDARTTLTSLGQTDLLDALSDAKSLTSHRARASKLVSICEKAVRRLEQTTRQSLISAGQGSISSTELLNLLNRSKTPPMQATERLTKIDFTRVDGAFEKDFANFLFMRGFEVAHSQNTPVDFVAVGKGVNGPIIIIGECQTNFATRDHIDKLYPSAKRIQDYCNSKGAGGVLESIYIVNFPAKDVPKDLRDLLFGRGVIMLDKDLLIKLSSCSNPEEVYKFITANRATVLSAR